MMTYGMLRGSVRTCVGDCRARVVLLQKVDHLSGSRRLRYSTEIQVTLLDGGSVDCGLYQGSQGVTRAYTT